MTTITNVLCCGTLIKLLFSGKKKKKKKASNFYVYFVTYQLSILLFLRLFDDSSH